MQKLLQRVTVGNPGKLLLAFACTPLAGLSAAALVIYCLDVASTSANGGAPEFGLLEYLQLTILGLFIFYPMSAAAVATIWLPLHILLAAFGRRAAGWYALAGVFCGLLVWSAVSLHRETICGDTSNPCLKDLLWIQIIAEVLLWGVVPRTTGALVFWAMMRPDRIPARALE